MAWPGSRSQEWKEGSGTNQRSLIHFHPVEFFRDWEVIPGMKAFYHTVYFVYFNELACEGIGLEEVLY